jgi:hypothetical protein
MPAMDKTGPFGTGPIGQGRGNCQPREGCRQGPRSGNGRCQRKGRGFGGRCSQTAPEQSPFSREEEVSFLERQLTTLQSRLDALKAKED